MKSKKGFILLTGGIFFLMGASASATVVADEVNAKDKAPAVAEVSEVAMAPAVTSVSQKVTAPLTAGAPAKPTLADIWDKNKCFVVLSGHCL
jgi:hypothetical protein